MLNIFCLHRFCVILTSLKVTYTANLIALVTGKPIEIPQAIVWATVDPSHFMSSWKHVDLSQQGCVWGINVYELRYRSQWLESSQLLLPDTNVRISYWLKVFLVLAVLFLLLRLRVKTYSHLLVLVCGLLSELGHPFWAKQLLGVTILHQIDYNQLQLL